MAPRFSQQSHTQTMHTFLRGLKHNGGRHKSMKKPDTMVVERGAQRRTTRTIENIRFLELLYEAVKRNNILGQGKHAEIEFIKFFDFKQFNFH